MLRTEFIFNEIGKSNAVSRVSHRFTLSTIPCDMIVSICVLDCIRLVKLDMPNLWHT